VRGLIVNSILWLQRNRDVMIHGFVVMSTHLHLVVTLPAAELSKTMHSLKSFTANEANKALERTGPLWDEGYHEQALTADEAIEAAVRYVEDNPVTARVVAAQQQYEWSSAWPEYGRIVDPWF
jgi:REP element-mobilizing transposase RayT